MEKYKNTIIALSTPIGIGGIAVVRMTGNKSIEIARRMIENSEKKKFEQAKIQRVTVLGDGIKDDAMAVFFYAPKSYTGEDTVEFHLHGGTYISERVIRKAIKEGARAAEAGEFTARAVMNGKMDLTQAEGVMDAISAESEEAAKSAYERIKGALKDRSDEIYELLSVTAAKGEVRIDYPDDYNDASEIEEGIIQAIKKIDELTKNYDSERMISSGVKVVIAGRANVGKSSLMNALLGYERAIVTDIEGTTRDTVEDSFEYKGVRFILCDTAGIRDTDDKVEKLGVERSKKAIQNADVVILADCEKDEYGVSENARAIKVRTKSDIKKSQKSDVINVSSVTGDGIEELKEKLAQTVLSGKTGVGVNNARQYAAAMQAKEQLQFALSAIDAEDVALSAVRQAMEYLGKITGKNASDDIIKQIFSRFCVGK